MNNASAAWNALLIWHRGWPCAPARFHGGAEASFERAHPGVAGTDRHAPAGRRPWLILHRVLSALKKFAWTARLSSHIAIQQHHADALLFVMQLNFQKR